jgi:hypothetical protein
VRNDKFLPLIRLGDNEWIHVAFYIFSINAIRALKHCCQPNKQPGGFELFGFLARIESCVAYIGRAWPNVFSCLHFRWHNDYTWLRYIVLAHHDYVCNCNALQLFMS